ncbi:MAG: hypothetical protein KGL39_08600 [Patescibacteria group bacterium]|nr:hypothetical protein [Patescibacteria group bacterium]
MPMEVANGRCVLNKYGSDTPVYNITPAEAIVLHTLHGPSNGGRTFGEEFTKITVIGIAKVDTGKTERKQVKAPLPAKKHEEIVTPQVSELGKPDYKPQVTRIVIDEPEQPAVFADVPVLVDRTPAQELARLRAKYGQAKNKKGDLIIDGIWADRLNPKMPEKFSDINWTQVGELSSSTDLQPASVNYVTGSLARSE